MIVQVRGGSGSGKSTLVRKWVEEHGGGIRYMMENAAAWNLGHIDCAKSRPFALGFPDQKVIVPGHYDAPGGGGDMIKSVYHIYDVVRTAVGNGQNILVEGLFVSKDAKSTGELLDWCISDGRNEEVHIILLDVSEEDCYESVMQRRRALGKEERFLRAHAKDYHAAHKAMLPTYKKWEEDELISFYHLNRTEAAAKVRELLG